MTATYSLTLLLGSHFIIFIASFFLGYIQGKAEGAIEANEKIRGQIAEIRQRLFIGRTL
jgi:hypothetical protein